MTGNGVTWNYTYDSNGMRTGRTNGTTTYSYVYNGGRLSQMTVGSDTLRYRGCVYDAETGLYHLQSRYYNPEVRRFIRADTFTSTGQMKRYKIEWHRQTRRQAYVYNTQ